MKRIFDECQVDEVRGGDRNLSMDTLVGRRETHERGWKGSS